MAIDMVKFHHRQGGIAMKYVTHIEFQSSSKEERLPDFEADFPCITTCGPLDPVTRPTVPWHWHKALELFYISSGAIDYYTPRKTVTLHAGCGGLVNSSVLHMTTFRACGSDNFQMRHLFDPAFLSGTPGSRIDVKYVHPLTASGIELIPLFPDQPEHAPLLDEIRDSFTLSPAAPGYELLLRERLSHIWLKLFALAAHQLSQDAHSDPTSDRVKLMMAYIHEHYAEPLSIRQLAQAAICSERECYRAFHTCLHMTPTAYLQSYRLQMARQQLVSSRDSLTAIAHSCGFGSSSYLGKVFRSAFGCTPMAYRNSWQDIAISRQETDI